MTNCEDKETVDLIASGYEWTCPICDKFHRVIEILEEVTCDVCNQKFQVNNIFHAY